MNRLGCSCSCLLGVTALLFFAAPLDACNVPVFRFALDRWRPQSYEIIVFHKGLLGAKDKAALRALGETPANVDVKLLDLDREPDESARRLFAEQEKPVLPWLVVRANEVDRKEATVWAGRLGEDAVNRL